MDALSDDALYEVANAIDNGKSWKTWTQLSHRHHAIAMKFGSRFVNHLWTLIKLFPDKEWSGAQISKNPNTTWAVFNDPQMIRDFDTRRCATIAGTKIALSWNYVVKNPNITWEFIDANIDDRSDVWTYAIQNPNVNLEIIRANPTKRWQYIAYNPHITYDHFLDLQNDKHFKSTQWTVSRNGWWRSMSKKATWKNIQDRPSEFWQWEWISRNPNITYDIVSPNLDRTWDFYKMSANRNITWKIICDSPQHPWSLKYFSRNLNLTIDNVLDARIISLLRAPDCNSWNWAELSQHPNITIDMILQHPDLGWQWKYVSANPNLTWKFVVDNPDLPWDYQQLSKNKFALRDGSLVMQACQTSMCAAHIDVAVRF